MRRRKIYRQNIDLKSVKNKTVVFCIPGKIFSNHFVQSWTELFAWCINNSITPILSNGYDAVVYYARNKCLGGDSLKSVNQKPFQGNIDYDYIMWIDSDMVFSPSDFSALLDMDKPIASGIYKMQNNHNYATVIKMEKNDYMQNGHYNFLDDKALEILPNIFRVDYTGFGWILFKKGVFETLKYPWFRPYWFNFDKNIKEFTSEDVGICKSLREEGHFIYVNKNLIIGHEKSCILR
tara:strand:+ start:771 stop:1478 length:708 start_codon:yes stop_codon:yes gene_type:complete